MIDSFMLCWSMDGHGQVVRSTIYKFLCFVRLFAINCSNKVANSIRPHLHYMHFCRLMLRSAVHSCTSVNIGFYRNTKFHSLSLSIIAFPAESFIVKDCEWFLQNHFLPKIVNDFCRIISWQRLWMISAESFLHKDCEWFLSYSKGWGTKAQQHCD